MSGRSASIRARLATLPGDTSGATAAEFAMVIGVFLTLVFGTIGTGMAMSAVNQIHYAAERSARCLAVNVSGDCTPGGIDAFAKGIYSGPGLTGLAFTTQQIACGHEVTGTGSFAILPGIPNTAFTVTARACYPVI